MRKLLFVFAIALLSLSAQDQPAAPGGGRGRGPRPPAKNLKVLADGPDLIPNMRKATVGLGVDCEFCHVRPAFDSDEKPEKVTARMMFSMVKDVNAKFPDGKEHVTCYTCHRGEKEPAMAPPAGAGGAGGREGRGGPPAQ
jgi:hypothetical protein